MRIEDYGLIGDLQSAALVGRNGSVDWLCLPRFDSPSCFSALLGNEVHGRWLVAPAGEVRSCSRRYRPGTLILETDFETDDGTVRVVDFMPPRGEGPPRLMRVVQALSGRVPMRMELSLRPDYASIVPWVEPAPDGILATAGPDGFRLTTALPLEVDSGDVRAEFAAVEGARERLVLTWHLSYEETPPVEDADSALARTEALAFRDFRLRVGTGDPKKIQIMYAIDGGRRLTEFELPELPGYEGSRPVRIGNAASEQFQLDVYGEVIAVGSLGATLTGTIEERLWPRWRTVVEHVETIWRES